jgi:RNA polymerase sigma-70 factor (ECF subfamily)
MDDREPSPLADLVTRTACGDERALGALYDAAGPAVFGTALRILDDRAAAEEVVLDVFLQVWRQAERWDPARGTPLGWLLMLARTRAIDRRRSGAVQRARTMPLPDAVSEMPSAAPGPEDDSLAAERRRLVRAALDALPGEQRVAVELAWLRGLSHAEVAAALGAPLGTVKTRIRLGMARLREALGEIAR